MKGALLILYSATCAVVLSVIIGAMFGLLALTRNDTALKVGLLCMVASVALFPCLTLLVVSKAKDRDLLRVLFPMALAIGAAASLLLWEAATYFSLTWAGVHLSRGSRASFFLCGGVAFLLVLVAMRRPFVLLYFPGRGDTEEKSRPNQPPLPTPGKCPPSNHDQLPGAADL